jgi:hypothetical protein
LSLIFEVSYQPRPCPGDSVADRLYGQVNTRPLTGIDGMCNVVVAALAIVLLEHCQAFGHPLIVHCSVSGTVVARLASLIIFIKSIDEFDGVDVIGSTSIASFRELIFACEDVGGW